MISADRGRTWTCHWLRWTKAVARPGAPGPRRVLSVAFRIEEELGAAAPDAALDVFTDYRDESR